MKMVDDKHQWFKWLSIHAFALIAAASASWALVPADMRASVPQDWMAYGAIALAVLGVIGRLTDQGGKS